MKAKITKNFNCMLSKADGSIKQKAMNKGIVIEFTEYHFDGMWYCFQLKNGSEYLITNGQYNKMIEIIEP